MGPRPALDRDLSLLVTAALALVPDTGRAILGIAGAPGAGKTTLTAALLAGIVHEAGPELAAHVPMDGFHLADAQLQRLGLSARKGAPETFDVAGYAAMLARLRSETGNAVYAPGFERSLEQPVAAALVVPAGARLVVTEGNYLLLRRPEWRAARTALDAVWWVETPDPVRTRRLVDRHIQFGKAPDEAVAWVAEVDEANAQLVRSTGDAPDQVVRESADGTWHLAEPPRD